MAASFVLTSLSRVIFPTSRIHYGAKLGCGDGGGISKKETGIEIELV